MANGGSDAALRPSTPTTRSEAERYPTAVGKEVSIVTGLIKYGKP